MKKLIASLILLCLIIFSGILSMNSIKKSSDKITGMVKNTSDLVASGNWSNASKNMESIQGSWDKTEKLWGILVDHYEIDNIEMAMTKSRKYIETKDTSMSLAELDNLKLMIEHIYSKESINIKNIL
jgi:hypothetical protein